MNGARTRGQATALAAVMSMIRGPAPQAVLLVGPEGVGKTTLALDLAAGLLCTGAADDRPCRICRSCLLADGGGHPDLHRLGPVGPGRQVVIGGPDAKYRGVRNLLTDLSLMPVEGGARVAIVESADRMNEDAQSALLKTLEEPPAGVTIVLCADQEARLLPTVRSRCFRVRLGRVGARDIETILADQGLSDPPLAARLGRLADGRPGLALAYALAPAAVLIRSELTRVLLDLTDARPSIRLAAARSAVPRAIALSDALLAADPATNQRRPARGKGAAAASATSTPADPAGDDDADDADGDSPPVRTPAVDRRRGVEILIGLWADVARDLVLVEQGGARSVHDPVMLEELTTIASAIDPGSASAFLGRAARSAELLANNVSPELVLDALVLAWPGRTRAA